MKDLFARALDRPERERAEFLTRECGDERHVRLEVESLLSAHRAAGTFAEIPAAALLDAADRRSAHAPRLAPADRLGAYEIVSFLSAGGMGEVYRARHTVLDRDVAIKTLNEGAYDPDSRLRLIREARHAGTLSHPNICRIYEVGDSHDLPFIVMELIEGEPLDNLVRGAPLPAERAIAYGVQIAAALEHAHSEGLVHRDLKSSNVVIDLTDKPVVLDFGLARRVDRSASKDESLITRDVTLSGTLSHMAPEILVGGEADVRTDVWSLGVLLHQMATGGLPFTGRTSFEMTAAILGQGPRPTAQSIALPLRLVIHRCLEKNPDDRYQDAAEVRRALEFAAGRSRWKVPAQLWKAARRRTLLAAAALVALASLGVLAGARARTGTTPPVYAHPVTSIGAMAFENSTPDRLGARFVGGVHNELTARLAQMAGLQVTSRTSIAVLTASTTSLRELGEDLSAGSVLLGHVRIVGERLQVGIRVMSAASGELLAEDGYERDAGQGLREVSLLAADSAAIHATAVRVTRALIARAVGGVAPEPRLTFAADRDGRMRVYVMRSDGSNVRALADSGAFAPAWSPDGRHIAFSGLQNSSVMTDREIYRVRFDGGNPRQLTRLRSSAGWPVWSPDGRRIAFHARLDVKGPSADWGLFVMNEGGSDPLQIQVGGSSLQPDWSPDGRRLVFIATPAGNTAAHMHVVNVDGSGLRQITRTVNASSPVWLPDGRRILYAAAPMGSPVGWQVHVMNDDGTGAVNLSRNEWEDRSAVWSSDGRIYFVRWIDQQRDLWSMNMDGSDQRQITTGELVSMVRAR